MEDREFIAQPGRGGPSARRWSAPRRRWTGTSGASTTSRRRARGSSPSCTSSGAPPIPQVRPRLPQVQHQELTLREVRAQLKPTLDDMSPEVIVARCLADHGEGAEPVGEGAPRYRKGGRRRLDEGSSASSTSSTPSNEPPYERKQLFDDNMSDAEVSTDSDYMSSFDRGAHGEDEMTGHVTMQEQSDDGDRHVCCGIAWWP